MDPDHCFPEREKLDIEGRHVRAAVIGISGVGPSDLWRPVFQLLSLHCETLLAGLVPAAGHREHGSCLTRM